MTIFNKDTAIWKIAKNLEIFFDPLIFYTSGVLSEVHLLSVNRTRINAFCIPCSNIIFFFAHLNTGIDEFLRRGSINYLTGNRKAI